MTKLAAHPTLYDVNQSPPKLIGSRCADCDAVFFPPLGIGCEVCGSTKLEAADLAASGTLHSVATVHLHANPKVETPFTVGEVSLDAGPLTRALLIEDLDADAIGRRVSAEWVVVGTDDDGNEIAEPHFRLDDLNDSAEKGAPK